MIWVRRILFLAIGLVITVVGFRFWSNFAGAMNKLTAERAAPQAVSAPANPGEVTVGIISAPPSKPSCTKAHPCK